MPRCSNTVVGTADGGQKPASTPFPGFLAEEVRKLVPFLTALRRDLHRYPESAWCEFRTASLAVSRLRELGYAVCMGRDAVDADSRAALPEEQVLAEARERALMEGASREVTAAMGGGFTALWADLAGGSGPCTAFRFDMDCNTIPECPEADHRPVAEGFASLHPGCMHACGHDGHVAVGLALAEALSSWRKIAPGSLTGTIRLIFQPAEEGARGALPMVRAGAMDGVERLFGLHLGFQAAPGEIICGTRDFFATGKRDVTFSGRSAHAAAAPEEGKNALLAACAATLNLHAISRHSGGKTRITVGRLAGGEARNVIPAKARLEMETRGESAELEAYMSAEAERILRAAADMWNCSCAIIPAGGSCSAASSPALAALVADTAADMGVFEQISVMKDFGATEDIAWMMREVQERGGQATYLQMGAKRAAGHHNSRFDFDEACLPRSLELLLRLAWRLHGSLKCNESGQGGHGLCHGAGGKQ